MMSYMQIAFLSSIGITLFLLLSLASLSSDNLADSIERRDREIAELRRRLKESEDCEDLLVEVLERAECWEDVAERVIMEAGLVTYERAECLRNQTTEEQRR